MPVFDDRLCMLGEGPIWHPQRKQLFWFDINGKAMLSRNGEEQLRWDFDDHVSAGGWVDHDHFVVATGSSLVLFNIETGEKQTLCDLEADMPGNRCNDGRADPYGGFWIGTMGIKSDPGAGSIYRYYKGELRKLFGDITVTNGTCFTPDRKWACYTDTKTRLLMRVALDEEGWPVGEPDIYLDFREQDLNIDGALFDKAGNVWIAHWGIHAVRAYAPDGTVVCEKTFPVTRVSCPAFGGEDFKTLYVTSARAGAKEEELQREPLAGATFVCDVDFVGQQDNRIIL
ncbi:SMP-30/gluconolactonase/LRE family protein [uncultured Cohaesibacter sp.]|uniref:SMP-30/gluconolactonase/LRE family protein n=1 Tax=uncultured Cohaesibacter sp. TaxID=1002546 RepID=UPI002931EF4E|nr:SMP-30/gluconolactonase/LRE family protein [uncultured Cohaesibacter sp.]